MAGGGVLGGGVQTVARYPMETMEVAKKYAGAPFRAAKAAIEPFYKGGREQILGRAVRESAGPNAQAIEQRLANPQTLVPGSKPTAAEVAQSGGVAAIQRSAASNNPEAYTTRATQQNEARAKVLQDMAGAGGRKATMEQIRNEAAEEMYEAARVLGINPDLLTRGRKGEVTKLLKTPAIQKAVEEAKVLARNEMTNIGNPSGSVKGLDYVKRALDDQIGKADGNERRVLVALKDRLLTTIDTLSPAYGQARQSFVEMSRIPNQMAVAEEISKRATNPLTGQVQPQAYARALTDDTAASATGFNKATLANTMEPQQLAQLEALKQDLARSVMARDLGRGPGSDTIQKLAMSNIMDRAGIPSNVANFPGISRIGQFIYGSSDEQMRRMLADALLNPRETARLMGGVPPYRAPAQTSPALGNKAALIGRMLTLPAAAQVSE
jgi:hypothetical protein